MCPRGTAFGVFGPRAREQLGRSTPGGTPAPTCTRRTTARRCASPQDARRFDVSPAWFSWVGAAPALELVASIGVPAIQAHDVALANRFRAGLGLAASDSAIVSAAVPDAARRSSPAGIRAAARAGSLRASFHLYNTEQDVDAALDVLVG